MAKSFGNSYPTTGDSCLHVLHFYADWGKNRARAQPTKVDAAIFVLRPFESSVTVQLGKRIELERI